MATTPADRSPESTLAFFREGYRFISTRCERYDTDIFTARLLLRTDDLPARAGGGGALL